MDTIEVVHYESYGRRSTFEFNIDSQKTKVKKTGLDAYEIEGKTTEEDWNKIVALLSQIDIPSLEKIKSPSTLHASDRAPAGQLSIRVKGKTYSTQTFDDNNPPEGLVKLIDRIYDISDQMGR
ncbi:MAG: hypothetical protein VXW38_12560 [Bacteroidota bacterium]|nr:hypothetical protein [Bacteroidota bacterium]